MLHLHFQTTTIFTLFLLLLSSTATTTTTTTINHRYRRLLHQPFFPTTAISQPPFPSPSPQPQPQQPKYPFSTLPPPDSTAQNPFFPFFPSPPPPPTPPTPTTAFATFPANISSLVLPSSSTSSHKPIKLISLIVSVSLFSFLVFASLLLRHRRHHHHHHKSLKTDSLRLFPPNTTPSDTTTSTNGAADNSKKPPPPLFPRHTPTSTSAEFLYLGTLVSSRDPDNYLGQQTAAPNDAKGVPPPLMSYQRLGSPELHPLPPLPRQHSHENHRDTTHVGGSEGDQENNNEEEEEDEEFFSPRESTKLSPPLNTFSNIKSGNEFISKSRSLNALNCNSSAYSVSPDNSPSVVLNSGSPLSIQSKSPDSLVSFPAAPLPRFIPPPPPRQPPRAFSPSSTDDAGTRDCSPRASDFSSIGRAPPPPPPPPPPARFWEAAPPTGPPELVAPSRKVVQSMNGEKGSLGNSSEFCKREEMMKPKLKPLHWDKVRASSDRAMVWDQLKSSSFQLNEEMIETLFMVSSTTANSKDGVRRHIIPEINQENLVLDQKKSQNISILLRALNVTVDEVCEALLEGNADALGTELLESLLKMAPTKEEEGKLKEFKDESPFKLGSAEGFLKAVLDIPFAFKRIDAMLYIANFESDVEHLKRSLDTLESACKELKSSRMFRKLLEAVLKTGNRMNIGTNRGDAHAFKLDTLLKLVDVKGADGKTTLLHFVVQEIIKVEGSRISGTNHNPNTDNTPHTLRDEVEFRKLGLQVVSGLSGELTNVKKAAAMDAEVLSNDVAKLAKGISKIVEVTKLNEISETFSDFINEFLKKAENEIANIQAQEGIALSMVKGLTEYFHGDSGKEESRPLRLFLVVRDFLSILDRVCKDVGKINERTMVNSARKSQMPDNVGVDQVFPRFGERQQQSSSSDDESSSSC